MEQASCLPRVALVTASVARQVDEDLALLDEALTTSGAASSRIDWDDPSVDWKAFDAVVVRSTWDYTWRLQEFLSWAERVSSLTLLLNPFEVIRWNVDKHYLVDLERAGVGVVKSVFIEPEGDVSAALDLFEAEAHCCRDLVIKPCVAAGSRGALRCHVRKRDTLTSHAKSLLDAGRSVVVQPYMTQVDALGETALIHHDGRFDHAIRKGPLLLPGKKPAKALPSDKRITSATPAEDELAVALSALSAVPYKAPLLYARVDLVRDEEGIPKVLELELTEPALFFSSSPGSADRYARAIIRRCRKE